jgi:hypothetical protein
MTKTATKKSVLEAELKAAEEYNEWLVEELNETEDELDTALDALADAEKALKIFRASALITIVLLLVSVAINVFA